MEAPASGGPTFFPKKVGGKKGWGRDFEFPPPHPLLRSTKKEVPTPFLDFPPSCSTGSIPAAKAYFVTPPPLGAGDHRSPLREARRPRRAVSKPQQPPRYFSGMVPTAARRAKPVQRSCSQGLQGNPDACHPRRGSACNVTVYKTGGDARLVFANQTQRTAAMSPRIGGSRVGEAPRPFFPPISSGRNGGARRAGPPRRGHHGVGTGEPVIRLAFGHPPSPQRGNASGG